MEAKELRLVLRTVESGSSGRAKLIFDCGVTDLDRGDLDVLVDLLMRNTIAVPVGGVQGEIGFLERHQLEADLQAKSEEVVRLKQRIAQLEQDVETSGTIMPCHTRTNYSSY